LIACRCLQSIRFPENPKVAHRQSSGHKERSCPPAFRSQGAYSPTRSHAVACSQSVSLKIRKSHIASLHVTRSAVARPHSGRKSHVACRCPSKPFPQKHRKSPVNSLPENTKVAHRQSSGHKERRRQPAFRSQGAQSPTRSHAVARSQPVSRKSESRPSPAFRSQRAQSPAGQVARVACRCASKPFPPKIRKSPVDSLQVTRSKERHRLPA
jgi:hypothetical protein